nr:homologous-pairing protein 2 homolog isoform X2 [Macaca fascicularis]
MGSGRGRLVPPEGFPFSQSPFEVRPPSPEGAVAPSNYNVRLSDRRDPPEVPAGAEPALQRPGCVREPAAGTRTGQGGGGEDAGAAGTTRQDQREDVRQAENLFCGSELKELSSALTTPEMQKEIQELKKECAGYSERLKNIKAATNHVTPEEKEQVYRERQKYCKEWRKRKRMATELSDAILEGYPKSKKQFFEEVGIETDEDYNVTLPDP